MARSKGGREGFALYTLDTSKLESSYVLKLSTLVEDLSIDLSLGAEQHRRDAYVCVHQISEDAVEDVESAMEIDRSKENSLHRALTRSLTKAQKVFGSLQYVRIPEIIGYNSQAHIGATIFMAITIPMRRWKH